MCGICTASGTAGDNYIPLPTTTLIEGLSRPSRPIYTAHSRLRHPLILMMDDLKNQEFVDFFIEYYICII